jgi:uracil-DNA glycosylase family 4
MIAAASDGTRNIRQHRFSPQHSRYGRAKSRSSIPHSPACTLLENQSANGDDDTTSTVAGQWHRFTGMSDQDVIRRMVVQHLESLRAAGVQQVGAIPHVNVAPAVAQPVAINNPPAAVPLASPSRHEYEPMPRKSAAAAVPAASASSVISLPFSSPCLSGDERLDVFNKMRKEVAGCLACKQLVRNRTQTVFGVGSVTPRVVFFGEAPGADEDKQGIPFVGRAGQLLTKIIEACTFKRDDVYIMNVLKCRPPDNRVPEPDEVANCRPFFERQFDTLQPEYIVCVGATPAQALLETTLSIGKLRGKFHSYRSSKVVCTYHPAYLLRNPDAKKFVWDDLQMMLREMGIDPAARKS